MLKVGLTGGIATGKSTVAAVLAQCGCRLIYADILAHRLMEPGGAAYDAVVREFGGGVLSAEGRVDRVKLGAIVFANPTRLARLNALVHPPVLEEQDRLLAEIAQSDRHAIAVVEAALLIEAGYDKKLDFLVVTWCTAEQQLERLMEMHAGRGLSREQAQQRIAAQMPLEQKRRRADQEIDCSGSLEFTRQQSVALYAELKKLESEQGR
jgi:dephospho-CoA kinase